MNTGPDTLGSFSTAKVEMTAAPTLTRPFHLADAMILTAALGIVLAWDRGHILAPFHRFFATGAGAGGIVWAWLGLVARLIEAGVPFLATGSLAMFIIRLRKPRPGLRGLLRQPGWVACAIGSLGFGAIALAAFGSLLASRPTLESAWSDTGRLLRPSDLSVVSALIGLAVLMAWTYLIAARRWQPEPGWIDRWSRVLGFSWIAMVAGGMLILIDGLHQINL